MRWMLLAWLLGAMPARAANTVAVLYFTHSDMNPELAGLKVGLAQMLITDLTGTAGLEVVERERLQAILDELELGHEGFADPARAAKVGKLLGARYMVLGGYFQLASTLRIDARVVEVETSRILDSHGVNGSVAEFMGMEAELAAFARRTLIAGAPPPAAPTPAVPPKPTPAPRVREAPAPDGGTAKAPAVVAPDAEALAAAVAFSDGLIFMDAGDAPKARESFEKAIAASPALDDARLALAKLTL